jgi:DHA1 family bicyclomycin/chloramphenicol resistance-like MFS transporter
MNDNGRKKKFYLILILGLLTAIGPFSIDMYLPAFPDIAKNLHTTVAQVTLSLSSFFIGISFGQLLYGPLLERFGIDSTKAFTSIRRLRRHGGSKSNGA